MAAGATYEPIATTTLSSAASSITLSSIPATYTDLRVVLICLESATASVFYTFNSDTAANYSRTGLYGDGSTATSFSNTGSSSNRLFVGSGNSTIPALGTVDIFSYAGSTFKTSLATEASDLNGSGYSSRIVNLWRSTSAITSITLSPSSGNFNTGTTATLYGILKA